MAQIISQLSPFEAVQLTLTGVSIYLFYLGAKSPQEKSGGYASAGLGILALVWGISKLSEFIR